MLVCHCRRVNDRAIAATVDEGARSVVDVAARCGAGSRCGGCWSTIRELLAAVPPCPGEQRHDAVGSVA